MLTTKLVVGIHALVLRILGSDAKFFVVVVAFEDSLATFF